MQIQSNIQVGIMAKGADRHSWNAIVLSNPHKTPYHLWEFGQALSSTYGYEKYNFVAKYKGEVIGLFPLLFVKSRLFGNKLLSLPFCEYGGPLIDSTCDFSWQVIKVLLKEIFLSAKNLDVDYIEVRNPFSFGEVLSAEGFHVSKKYVTFGIDLSKGKEHLWRALDKKTRNSTRKGMKNNLDIRKIQNEADLKDYFYLYLKTQKKHGSPPHDFKLFQNLFRLNSENSMNLFIAKYRKRPIAGVIVFYDGTKMYWWGGVSDPQFKNLNASDVLLWTLIEWGIEKGFLGFDLGRTRRSTTVYHFKKGWGGVETPLLDYVFSLKSINSFTPDPTEGKYQVLTRLWSHLPMALTKSVGPKIAKNIGL